MSPTSPKALTLPALDASHDIVPASPRGKLLLLVVGLHVGMLAWAFSRPATPPPVTPPTVIGVLLPESPPAPVEPPKPLPAAPEVHKAPVPKPVAALPLPKAAPSERAVTAPPETAAPGKPEAPAASPASAPTPPAPAAPPVPAPVTPPRTDAAHLNNPAPAYPPASRKLGEQGRVLLDVYILPNGAVGEIKLKQSSGHARLDEAALNAVRRWRYLPAKRGDEPIPFWYVQPIEFSLTD
ncbi:energy transducer TonB [Parachitinimonas caeni]|uniref:Energy transducer TonB n=1 Tax=Parachitinimonas caeni TaxID=3031301 RepID=A0ABT7DSF4_9NEIS|nr:energy transducer TonB [Parachitinimonas caeni]MDK2123000.1 energy transducer TonB [Parachitinimonas caeni]